MSLSRVSVTPVTIATRSGYKHMKKGGNANMQLPWSHVSRTKMYVTAVVIDAGDGELWPPCRSGDRLILRLWHWLRVDSRGMRHARRQSRPWGSVSVYWEPVHRRHHVRVPRHIGRHWCHSDRGNWQLRCHFRWRVDSDRWWASGRSCGEFQVDVRYMVSLLIGQNVWLADCDTFNLIGQTRDSVADTFRVNLWLLDGER